MKLLPLARSASIIIVSLLLSACSDCNILSSRMPTHCQVGLGAAAILTAPITIPYVLAEEALSRPVAPTRPAASGSFGDRKLRMNRVKPLH